MTQNPHNVFANSYPSSPVKLLGETHTQHPPSSQSADGGRRTYTHIQRRGVPNAKRPNLFPTFKARERDEGDRKAQATPRCAERKNTFLSQVYIHGGFGSCKKKEQLTLRREIINAVNDLPKADRTHLTADETPTPSKNKKRGSFTIEHKTLIRYVTLNATSASLCSDRTMAGKRHPALRRAAPPPLPRHRHNTRAVSTMMSGSLTLIGTPHIKRQTQPVLRTNLNRLDYLRASKRLGK